VTNATTQKVYHFTLNSFSGSHRYALGGAWAIGGAYGIIYVQCDRLGADRCKPHLPWTPQIGLRIQRYWGFVVVGNTAGYWRWMGKVY
jgi:hypothetical protein